MTPRIVNTFAPAIRLLLIAALVVIPRLTEGNDLSAALLRLAP